MINVENLSKSFGPQVLYKNASFLIGAQEKIGVIGPNGAGKSTFFKILMGEEQPDSGDIRSSRTTKKGLLRQEWVPLEGDSVLTATLRTHAEWFEASVTLNRLTPMDPEYSHVESTFLALGGYEVEPKAKMILTGLGLSPETFNTPCELLSGGWRMRVQLAGLLVSEPNLLLLDEPTNHLDVESIVWFEDFLLHYPRTFMIISHDRRLIEHLTTSILEFSPPKATLWPVGFSKFERDKAARMAQIESEIENRQKEVARLEAFASRFKAKASKARQAQSKLRSSERVQEELEKLQEDMPLTSKRPSKFRIRPTQRTPKTAFSFENAEFGYERVNPLFSLKTCVVEGGKKVGIIGVNGVGKSTFLKTCAGELPLLNGSMRRNESLKIAYFAQHRLEDLPLEAKAYDYLESSTQGLSISEIRAAAASLGLMAHDLDKTVRLLSGGEKSRLSLTKLILSRPDVFLLDEPTNHLDLEACDALVQGLREYEGTVLVVSHNRDFLDQLVEQVLEVRPEEAWIHHGNYSEWVAKKGKPELRQGMNSQEETTKAGKKTKEQKRQEAEDRQKKYAQLKGILNEIQKIESDMENLKSELQEIDLFLADPESPRSNDFTGRLKKRAELASQLERLEEAWLNHLEKKQEIESLSEAK